VDAETKLEIRIVITDDRENKGQTTQAAGPAPTERDEMNSTFMLGREKPIDGMPIRSLKEPVYTNSASAAKARERYTCRGMPKLTRPSPLRKVQSVDPSVY
jgi:hypothetical protein